MHIFATPVTKLQFVHPPQLTFKDWRGASTKQEIFKGRHRKGYPGQTASEQYGEAGSKLPCKCHWSPPNSPLWDSGGSSGNLSEKGDFLPAREEGFTYVNFVTVFLSTLLPTW